MAWHPSFLEKFADSYDLLLRAEGPLPHSWRHYLAIISAARFKCDYVVKQQEQEFLMAGGDEEWLKSPQNCPPKLVRLLEVNAILAHHPWRLEPAHITELMKCADSSARWSVGELVQAFVLLATFRGISGLAIGMGINTEVDISVVNAEEGSGAAIGGGNLEIPPASASSTYSSNIYDKFNHKTLSDSDESNLERHAEPSNTERLTSKLATCSVQDDDAPQGDAETRKQLFEAAGDASAAGSGSTPSISHSGGGGSSASSALPSISTTPSSSSAWHPEQGQLTSDQDRFWKYNAPYAVKHSDFDVRSKDYSVFHIQDWSWEEQAYELIERTYNSTFAQLLDTEFQTIFELTYNQVNGEKNVDTAPFRRSIWYYVHRIHGILHDDYNYATVNELLLRNLKKFTKDLSCTPFAVTPQDLLNLGYSLSPEEKCHIALLATEARKQAELMYALHSLSKHLAST